MFFFFPLILRIGYYAISAVKMLTTFKETMIAILSEIQCEECIDSCIWNSCVQELGTRENDGVFHEE